jgi:hypothetical protein
MKNQIRMRGCWLTENIEVFMEGQAFLPSYDMAFPHELHTSDTRLRKRDNLWTGEKGGRVGEEPNPTTAKKPRPL